MKDNSNNKGQQQSISSDEETSNDSMQCPLFMTSLPTDFASNSGLAAIASLITNDEDSNIEKPKKQISPIRMATVKSGGGKAVKERSTNRRSPYKKETTVNEAQLFLKLWKM